MAGSEGGVHQQLSGLHHRPHGVSSSASQWWICWACHHCRSQPDRQPVGVCAHGESCSTVAAYAFACDCKTAEETSQVSVKLPANADFAGLANIAAVHLARDRGCLQVGPVVSRIGSLVGRTGSVVGRVGLVVSRIGSVFGRIGLLTAG